jgi:hypothetical protein
MASAEGETPHVALTNCSVAQPFVERKHFSKPLAYLAVASTLTAFLML